MHFTLFLKHYCAFSCIFMHFLNFLILSVQNFFRPTSPWRGPSGRPAWSGPGWSALPQQRCSLPLPPLAPLAVCIFRSDAIGLPDCRSGRSGRSAAHGVGGSKASGPPLLLRYSKSGISTQPTSSTSPNRGQGVYGAVHYCPALPSALFSPGRDRGGPGPATRFVRSAPVLAPAASPSDC